MKTIIFALFGVLLTTSIALAAWQDTFSTNFAKNGAATVASALALGASPGEIIDVASAAGIEPKTLVTAMCEAGLSPQDLQGFLAQLGNMSANVLMTACVGPGNISLENRFPGANPETFSVSKEPNYASIETFSVSNEPNDNGTTVDGGTPGGGTPSQPASGNNFNQ